MTKAPKKLKSHRGKYQHEIRLSVTPQMLQFLRVVAERGQTTVAHVVREAIRAHLDEEEGIIGSRSRFAGRIARQLEIDREHLTRCVVLILAAELVPFIDRGAKGSQVLEQIHKVAGQADSSIRELIAGKAK